MYLKYPGFYVKYTGFQMNNLISRLDMSSSYIYSIYKFFIFVKFKKCTKNILKSTNLKKKFYSVQREDAHRKSLN